MKSQFILAAAHKSSGKTVISTGIAAALAARGLEVQCFKKGPDYIDPMWLSAASDRPCYNLDFNTMHPDEITRLFRAKSVGADVVMIEANKGLYDGVDPLGSDSNAALAKHLSVPVVLVIDTVGMTRGIAPLLLGYDAFDKDLNIAGVILNKVGGSRHESKLRTAIEAYTSMPVIGSVWRHPDLDIGERHLGLTPPAETGELARKIENIGAAIADSVDLDKLLATTKCRQSTVPPTPTPAAPSFRGIRVGVARDVCFGFYYPDDLERFEELGATLVPFDTLASPTLPDIDGLFIGGGFPECKMRELSENVLLRVDIKKKIENGLPAYAECGGLMYLCRSMKWGDATYPMCDVIDGDAVMYERPQGRGYTKFTQLSDHPWGSRDGEMSTHEFHYARIENLDSDTVFARKITRGHGIDGAHDGIVKNNLLAGFIHLRNSEHTDWVSQFLKFVVAEKPKR